MENLVNKKVRLQNRLTKTTLVACSDKKSVNHIRLDDNKPKPENSVWIIKSNHPDKSIRLESVYGKFLAWKTSVTGGIAMQVNRSTPQDKAVTGVHNWWTFVDVDRNGFNCVLIQSSHTLRRCANLYPDSNTQVMVGLKRDFSPSFTSRLEMQVYIWDIEFVKDPIIDPGPGPSPSPVISKPEDNPPVTLPIVEGIPSTNYTYQVDRMYVYQQGVAGTSFPFPNYANTGRNVNKSGTQIVGGVNIHTHIDNFITW